MQRGEARLAHRSSALQQQTEAMLARIQEQGHAGAVGVQVLTAGPPGPLLPPPRVLHGASQCLQLSERATDRTWAWLHSSVPDPPLGARAATPLQVLTPHPCCRLPPLQAEARQLRQKLADATGKNRELQQRLEREGSARAQAQAQLSALQSGGGGGGVRGGRRAASSSGGASPSPRAYTGGSDDASLSPRTTAPPTPFSPAARDS